MKLKKQSENVNWMEKPEKFTWFLSSAKNILQWAFQKFKISAPNYIANKSNNGYIVTVICPPLRTVTGEFGHLPPSILDRNLTGTAKVRMDSLHMNCS